MRMAVCGDLHWGPPHVGNCHFSFWVIASSNYLSGVLDLGFRDSEFRVSGLGSRDLAFKLQG